MAQDGIMPCDLEHPHLSEEVVYKVEEFLDLLEGPTALNRVITSRDILDDPKLFKRLCQLGKSRGVHEGEIWAWAKRVEAQPHKKARLG